MFKVKWLKFYILILISSFISAITLSYLKPSFENIYSFFYVFFLLTIPSITVLFLIKHDFKRFTDTVHSILNQIDDGIIIKDEQGKYTYCNEIVAKVLGTTTQDIIGKNIHDFSNNKEQNSFIDDNFQEVLSTFEKQKVNQSTTDVNTGKIHYLSATKIPFKNSRNKKYVFILAKDITEIKILKEETEKTRSRLEKVLEASEECIWEWNAKTNKTNFNHQWERITGIVKSDHAYEDFEQAILPEDKLLYHQATERTLKENVPFNIEFRMKRPDSTVIWVWNRGRIAEYDEEGNPLWVVGITMDITTSKQALAKIKELAYYDQLTGLANRTTLENELKKVSGDNEPSSAYSGLLLIDLDRFKLLNDG
ncbi:PAS domain S-box protein, partial [Marinomonas sp.]